MDKTLFSLQDGSYFTGDGIEITIELLEANEHEIDGNYGWIRLCEPPKTFILPVSKKTIKLLITSLLTNNSRAQFYCDKLLPDGDNFVATFANRIGFPSEPDIQHQGEFMEPIAESLELMSMFINTIDNLYKRGDLQVIPTEGGPSIFERLLANAIEAKGNATALLSIVSEMDKNLRESNE